MVRRNIVYHLSLLSFIAVNISLCSQNPNYPAEPKHISDTFQESLNLFRQKRYSEALFGFKTIVSVRPDCVEALFNIGLIHMMDQHNADAINAFEQVLQYAPDNIKAAIFLGNLYMQVNDFTNAERAYTKALNIDSKNIEALLNSARIQHRKQNNQQAKDYYNDILTMQSDHKVALFEYATLLTSEHNYDEAIPLYKKLLADNPSCLEARLNLAHVLRYAGKFKESIPHYYLVIQSWTDNPFAHTGLGEALLACGNYADGWKEFHWRLQKSFSGRNLTHNLWDGSDIAGKTILLRSEDIIQDTMQGLRYAKMLKKLGAHIILEAPESLFNLLSLCDYIDQLIPITTAQEQLPLFDYQIPLMSLPHICKSIRHNDVEQIVPYLQASPSLIEHWRIRLSADKKFKVGICWQDFFTSQDKQTNKIITLAELLPLFSIPGISIYSLQPGFGPEHQRQLPTEVAITAFPNFDTEHGLLMDSAALIKNLDLVLTIDGTIAHLAGALNVPTYVLTPYAPDWRWQQYQTTSIWYPSITLMRQIEPHNWKPVIDQVIFTINKTLSISHQQLAVHTEVAIGELIDKLTILQIKKERFSDPVKLDNVSRELASIEETLNSAVIMSPQLTALIAQLKSINIKLWDIEDDIRAKEYNKQFDEEFIKLARSVYFTNDERGVIKRKINELLGSRLVEEKTYTAY